MEYKKQLWWCEVINNEEVDMIFDVIKNDLTKARNLNPSFTNSLFGQYLSVNLTTKVTAKKKRQSIYLAQQLRKKYLDIINDGYYPDIKAAI